jgi:hypothetical protein
MNQTSSGPTLLGTIVWKVIVWAPIWLTIIVMMKESS